MALKARHYQAIEFMLANPTMSQTQWAKELGVSRNTIGDWRKNKEFMDEYNRQLKEIWQDSESIAVATMRNLAIEGNFQASKYILDSLGYAPTTKIEADVKQSIIINIGEDDEPSNT